MPLEAVMIAVDNSEWTRNGDYAPTRFSAQTEAVSYLANAKLQENQESSVGLMTLAGNRIQVLISPGREPGQLLNSLARDVKIGGESNFLAGLKTAQLALKNRANKNQRQRVIMFVASPLGAGTDAAELVKLGKLLKKNNVAIDIINFGTENASNDNTEKLEQLIAAVNTGDNSHLVTIPPGPHIFADMVLSSSIMAGGGGGGSGIAGVPGAGGASAGPSHMGGIDPNMDPEMAMAIRMSMEEERQRQQKASGGDAGATAGAPAAGSAGGAAAAPMEEDEDALLAQAIALSMQENQDAPMADASAAGAAASAPAAASTAAPAASPSAAPAVASAEDIDLAMQDPDFLNSLLAGVPGADGQSMDNLLDELTGGSAAASGTSAAGSTSSTGAAKPDEKKKDADKK